MKQETSKKSKKWIWLVAGAVLLLAIVGVVLALVLGGGSKDAAGGRADLYWNVDRLTYLETGGTGLSNREPAEDGLYHVKFAYNGEHVEYTVSDKRLINFIDSQEVMGLKFDDDGMVIDAVAAVDLATEVGHPLYVQGVEGSTIKANTSPSMNALSMDLAVTENTHIYDVTSKAELVGGICDVSVIEQLDRIYVYANELEEITHIYIVKHAVKSPVYWRVQQFYNSSKKETTREPDENGVYTIDFFCDGELVTLKCKKKDVVTGIDSRSVYSAHMGLEFDEEGYISNTVGAAEGIGGLLLCDRYWITSFNGNVYTAEKPGTSDPVHNFAIPSTAKIYDVGKAAMVEGRQGKQVDYVNEGDRVCVWTDTNGVVVLVYVSNSIVDVPVFFNRDRQYDSKTLGTAREPDSQGYYHFELYEDGATGMKTYKTKDKAVADYLDSINSRIVGLVVEGDIIIRAYDPECVFGNTHYTYGRYVNDITGPIMSCILIGQPLNANTAVLSPTCEVYNVSGYGEYGLTTLQVGDCVYAMRDPSGEVVRIYILRRYMGEEYLYFMLDSQYDAETKSTKREPDEDGWYRMLFAYNGKQVTLRTRSKAMVEKVESIDSVGAAALIVSGDVIVDAHPPQNATGGSKVSSGYRVKSFNEDGTITTYYKERTYTFRMADDCVIYNVSNHTKSYKGETIYSLQFGDMLTVFTNWRGEAKIIYVRNRVADNLGWKTEQKYDGTNKVTTREPDADGWYYVDIAVNGAVKTYKTKNKELMSNIDSYGAAFGFSANGDVLTGVSATSWTRGVGGNGVTNYDVVAINGNKVTVKYNVPGSSSTGTTKTIYLSSNTKVYDVSPTAEQFGAKAKLQVGDRIRTYISDSNSDVHAYAYILYHDTRVKGQEAYCEHCKQVVYWNPWAGESLSKVGSHYYLNTDVEAQKQTTVGSDSKDYEVVIDLNGKTIHYDHTSATLVRYNDTLSIMDSVGGGKMTSTGNDGALTGMFMVNSATVNLYSGTFARSENEERVSHGGIFRLHGATLNVYGGEITNGTVEPVDKNGKSYGGNIYAQSKSVINLYGGKISAGIANSFAYMDLDKNTGEEVPKSVDGLGGNIYLTSKSELNVYGGELVGGNAVHGGNVYIAGGSANFFGGVVADGVATNGGNIYIGGGAMATVLDNALITRGTSTRAVSRNNGGGNFFLQKDATLVMLGGSITDGTAVSYGGNIACRGGLFTIVDGVVSGGKSETGKSNNVFINGRTGTEESPDSDAAMVAFGGQILNGDVYSNETDAEVEARIGLSGTPVIEELNLDPNARIEVYELEKGADITLSATGTVSLPYEKAAEYVKAGYFKHVYADLYQIKAAEDNSLYVEEKKLEMYCEHCGENALWSRWTYGSGMTVTEDGHYYLTENVTNINSQIRIGVDGEATPDVVIDLKGHTMLSENKRVFAVYPGSTLSIMDSVGGGLIQGAMTDKSQNGGVIRVDAGSTLNLYSGEITDGSVLKNAAHLGYGGAISTEGGTINIAGGTVNGGTARYGGTIYVSKSSAAAGNLPGNLIISGGVINGGVAADEAENPFGGAIFVSNGNFTMSGGKVTGGQAISTVKTPGGGNIYLSGNDTYKFEITGGTIEGGTATNGNGGNIYLANGTLTVAGDSVISGGIADRASARTNGGGNIYAQLSTTLIINGGEIKDGTAVNSYGGNVLVRGNTTMTGGVISGGTATNGGNVFVNGYTEERVFTMTGGEIKDGTATTGRIDRVNMVKDAYDGDNIYVNSAIIDISGGAITDNDGGNAILAYTAKADYPAIVRMTLADNEELAADLDSLVYLISGAQIFADKGGTKADADGDKVWMLEGFDDVVDTEPTTAPTVPTEPSAPTEPPVADLSGNCPHCGEKISDLTWIEWTGGSHLTASGHYYLSGDIAPAGQREVGKSEQLDVVVDLRGYTYQPATGRRTFTVYNGSTLSIFDTAGSAKVIGSYTSDLGATINVSLGTVNLYGGTFTTANTENANKGGVIALSGESALNIYEGATVIGGPATFGGAIYANGGDVTIHGGLIQGGTATYETSNPVGGAIAVLNGDFVMTGGKVTGGSASSEAKTATGGNIYLSGSSNTFEITGGIIEGGIATNGNGGNIFVNSGTLTIAGDAKIIGGSAQRATSRNNGGGNIYVSTNATLNINGGEILDGVSVDSYGGNILCRGTLNMTGGLISGGTATNGGNVFVNGYTEERVFTMTGGEIKDGTATTGQIDRVNMVKDAYDGDNIYVNSAILNISGGMITDNDGGNAVLAYTAKAEYPAIVNLEVAENAELANALDGKVYIIDGADLNADIGGTSADSDNDLTWFKEAPATEPTEPSTPEETTAPTTPEETTAPTTPEETTAPTTPEETTAPTTPEETTAPTTPEETTAPTEPTDKCPHCGEVVEWVEWTGGGHLTASGHYYLSGDITPGGQREVGKTEKLDVVVDLRGHTYQPSAGKRTFTVYSDSTLSVLDTVGGAQVIGSYISDLGATINISLGTVNLYGGTFTTTNTENANEGGVIAVGENSALNIYEGATVVGGPATFGGAIYANGGDVTIYGGLIRGGTATYETSNPVGGAIAVLNGDFVMTGGKVSGGSANTETKTATGGNIYLSGSSNTFEITGGIIEGGTATNGNGGNIFVNSGTLTIAGDAKIIGGSAQRATSRNNGGGNIYVQVNATLNINGGEILDGVSVDSFGGNVLCRGTLNMTDGTISGGTALNGGNVFMNGYNAERVFTMTGGEIKDGTATTGIIDRTNMVKPEYDGDNIYINSAILNITGGMITDNDGGNAVLAYTPQADYPAIVNLEIAEDADLAAALDGRIYLISGSTINADIGGTNADSDNDLIWVKEAPATEPTEPSTPEETTAPTTPEETTVPSVPEETTAPTESVDVECPHCTDAQWQAKTLVSGEYITESGHYYLTEDALNINSQIRIGKDGEAVADVVLDLRGHDITSTTRAFYLSVGSKLTIIDSVGEGEITGAYADTAVGGAIYLSASSADAITELNMYGGIINSVDAAKKTGGTVYLSNYSRFNMYGGVLNSAPGYSGANGACIYSGAANTEINLYGGTINGSDKLSNRGGLIYIGGNKDTTVLNISGDVVINGGYAGRGGTVFVNAGTLNISGGTISGASADSTGSAICMYTANAVLNMTGGTISSANGETDAIGTVWIGNGATVNISGGTISDQLVVDTTAVLTLSGAPTIGNMNMTTSTVPFTLGEGGVTGGNIGVTGVAGAISNASEDAKASAQYFSSLDSALQITETEGQICLVAEENAVRSLAKAVVAGGLKSKLLIP